MQKLTYILIICLFAMSCEPFFEKPCRQDFLFEIPVSVYPNSDTLHIGDTLWIEMSFSDELVDLNTEQTYQLENFQFYTETHIGRIDSTVLINAVSLFEHHSEIGQITYMDFGGGAFGGINYDYQNNTYRLKAGLICLKKGTYSFDFSSYF